MKMRFAPYPRWISVWATLLLSLSLLLARPTITPTSAAPLGDDDGGTHYPTSGACGRFQDVYNSSWDQGVKKGVQFMGCNFVIGGYQCGEVGEPCGTESLPYFRPGNNITKGQLAKIVIQTHSITPYTGAQLYSDVAPGNPFYSYVQTAGHAGWIQPREYWITNCTPSTCTFGVYDPARRNQVARAVVAGYYGDTSPYNHYIQTDPPTFTDVDDENPYYGSIEVAYKRGLLNGYDCGGAGEPCDALDRPYFRPDNYITRGAAMKVDANARFYHKGVAGYGNLVPYPGSPNFSYGATNIYNTDYSIIPSGLLNYLGSFDEPHITGLGWSSAAISWFRNDSTSGPTAIEMGLGIDSAGVHTCPAGSWNYKYFDSNLPGSSPSTLYSGYACGSRLFFDRTLVNSGQYYSLTMEWQHEQNTGDTGRIQAYQLQETCKPACGGDMTKADMLAHYCYKVGSLQVLVRCLSNP